MSEVYIKRFTILDRVFHLGLMITFIIQGLTGFSRIFITSVWGERLASIFGGYEGATVVHKWVGLLMIIGFVLHTIHMLLRINWSGLKDSLLGPDSILPVPEDFRDLWKRILWFFGLGQKPSHRRWTYWEKFDYWAVYWGLPLLALTGLMLMYPIAASRLVPGWLLNIASLLHQAEAVLAVVYICIIHFYMGHFRPANFPFNAAMFSGSVPYQEAEREWPGWVERLRREERLIENTTNPPKRGLRIASYIIGYLVVICGLFLAIAILGQGHGILGLH
ncbi:MAG: cytochrome b/b6 domain-containing protein [Desulfohalobiaceae bacterium]|nr:cytochrome b/b6 domain-containing protein [Desulfohalobiaceae bacterium]